MMENSGDGADTDMVVAVEGLTFSYGRSRVLHGLTFRIGRGEVVGLLGPNGAGKSTTIKILSGVLPPGEGDVEVAGHVMPEESVDTKKHIG